MEMRDGDRRDTAAKTNTKDILQIYKYPGIALLLITFPGVNMLYFHQHALLTPLIYSLPLWVPYILFRLLRLMKPEQGALRVAETPGRDPSFIERTFYRKYGSLSFALFLVSMYPLSRCAAASLNWSGTWGLHWKPHVLYKMSTFPIGFVLPPYGSANQETLDTMLLFARSTLR